MNVGWMVDQAGVRMVRVQMVGGARYQGWNSCLLQSSYSPHLSAQMLTGVNTLSRRVPHRNILGCSVFKYIVETREIFAKSILARTSFGRFLDTLVESGSWSQ